MALRRTQKPQDSKQGKVKIYTRTGDKGETALFGGQRVPKDHPRVAAYGSIDELNATLGLAIVAVSQRTIAKLLQGVQNDLFDIGAELSSPKPVKRDAKDVFFLPQEKIAVLEEAIDRYDARLPALHTFILPSGSQQGALLHLARTVCRRAEREVVTLARSERVNPNIIVYLNRLSDLLFVLARYVNKAAKSEERAWKK
jgi:cob(I)alamin adenosyltransferase